MTISNAWTSLVMENHRLENRLFPETVVFTVEWCHWLFAVRVQSLHLQLVVTEIILVTYCDRKTTDRALFRDLHRHNVTTQTAALHTSLITRHPTAISCISCVVSTEQPCSQYSKHSHSPVTHSILNAVSCVVSTEQPCSQCSKHSDGPVTYSILNAVSCVVSTEQPCSQCSTHSHCPVTHSILNAISCVVSTEQPCSQCSTHSHCPVTHSILNAISCVVSTEQPCSQYSKHSHCPVIYSILNSITWTSHNCSQCSVSNLHYMFWHRAVSPSQLFTIQLWHRPLSGRFHHL